MKDTEQFEHEKDGKLDNDHQSNYIFKNGLLLTLYVDDVLLSGPENVHAPC